MIKTFSSYSFGCRVNHAEREEIDRQMVKRGVMQVVDNPDVFIINTCSITNEAERSARKLIYQTKKLNPHTKIVVTGCSATYWLKHGLYKTIPADMFIDNIQKEFLVTMLLDKIDEKKSKKINQNTQKFISPPTDKFLDSSRMVIKIQDGCHRFCTFCIVPYLRGLPKSVPTQEIVSMINLSPNKIHEAILTAINTEAYGKDSNENFIDLIRSVIDRTNVDRVSFGSVHPWSITDEFLELYLDERAKRRLVHFFHIPLQSGSNKILTLMRRVHTREDMLERTKQIAKYNPNAFLATDVIVGFLEENDDDFGDTYSFLQDSPISKFHVFRYSRRIQTAGYYMAKRLMEPTDKQKKQRSYLLRELSDQKYSAFQKKLIGYSSSVLMLQKKQHNMFMGLLDNQIPIFLKEKPKAQLSHVVVEDFQNNSLIGRAIS